MLQRFVLAILVLACGCAAGPPLTRPDGVIEQRFDGPALLCGAAFAIELRAGEHAIRRDPQMDFLTYYVDGPYGSFVLYEGNAPQPYDDAVQTGRRWPELIAIHDNRGEAGRRGTRIRDRFILGERHAARCTQPMSNRE